MGAKYLNMFSAEGKGSVFFLKQDLSVHKLCQPLNQMYEEK